MMGRAVAFAIAAAVLVTLMSGYYYPNFFQTSHTAQEIPSNLQPQAPSSSTEQSEATYTNTKCDKPVTKIVFVKTHKTSGTAVNQLLVRYWNRYSEDDENRTVPLPAPFVGGYPGRFRCVYKYPKDATASFNHVRHDPTEMKKCFAPETRYITLLREPLAAFQSAHRYYGLRLHTEQLFCYGMPLAYLLHGGERVGLNTFLEICDALLNTTVPWYFRFQNYQSHDLGIDPTLTNDTEIRRRIEEIDENMDLVMLHEYMDESLLLLKDTLCMEWEDILMSKVTPQHNSTFEFASEQHKKVYRKLNSIDIALYEHFNRTLWKRVEAYGRGRLDEGLKKLRTLRKRVKRDGKEQDAEQETEDKELEARSEEWWKSIREYMVENAGGCYMPDNRSKDNFDNIENLTSSSSWRNSTVD